MCNVVSNVVEGDDFFDREKEQALAWRRLAADHLLLLAPRRVGKSSLMRKLIATAEEHSFPYALECSLSGCRDELACMAAIMEGIRRLLGGGQGLVKTLQDQLGRTTGI